MLNATVICRWPSRALCGSGKQSIISISSWRADCAFIEKEEQTKKEKTW